MLDRGLHPSLDNVRLFPPLNINEAVADEIVQLVDLSLRTGISAEISRKYRLAKEFLASRLS